MLNGAGQPSPAVQHAIGQIVLVLGLSIAGGYLELGGHVLQCRKLAADSMYAAIALQVLESSAAKSCSAVCNLQRYRD